MSQTVDTYLYRFTLISAAILGVAAVLCYFIAWQKFPPFLLAYSLSFAFTGSNFLVMRKINLDDQSRFVHIFGWSLALRFILVLAGLVLILKAQNKHQIFFTVSFIFSYICHSVIEIIFLNKILKTETEN